ncbi:MAG: acylneuraminate cytidylyltransferase family protein [Nitrospirae bacterium]|nr:acylneuraminate cytidylyltransferase family protein [Nitrospirota bacterium]MBF0535902.1 acylneuraminate cytidylyltransferase family protein [Nitrospirota bacterium]MBF0617765.1 acylneuraminate cytidylyltransferase family protein [Nitrospirota bacterium]
MEVLAIIPARGGSKGIPGKNLRPLYGKPLIHYTLEAIRKSKTITKAILTTDSDEIMAASRDFSKIEIPFKRPPELARDNTPMLPVVTHAVEFLKNSQNYRPDYIVLLQPTSPLRTHIHIDEALQLLLMHNEADSVVSVVELPHNCNPFSIMKYDGKYLQPFMQYDESKNLRQLKPRFYARNGAAIYASTYECLMVKKSFYGDTVLPYFMKKEDSIDIDDQFDFKTAEFLISQRANNFAS